MDKEDLLSTLKSDRRYEERKVKEEIQILRNILDMVDERLESGNPHVDDGFQGNEWRLYKHLSHLEKLNEVIKSIEELK